MQVIKVFLLIIVCFLGLNYSVLAEKAEAVKGKAVSQQTGVSEQLTKEELYQKLIESNEKNGVASKDVYDALLKTKDDKIMILSNYVNWILAGVGIALAAVIAFFTWIGVKLNRKKNEAERLIRKLTKKEEEITTAQEKINMVLESGQYIDKIEEFEKNLQRLENRTSRSEQDVRLLRKEMLQTKKNYEEEYQKSSQVDNKKATNDLEGSIFVSPQVKRGDVYMVEVMLEDKTEETKRRPVLVIQNDVGNKFAPEIIVAPIRNSVWMKNASIHVPIELNNKEQIVSIDRLFTINKEGLKEYICTVDEKTMDKVNNAIAVHLGLI